jgi:hypothetical protein
MQIFVSIMLAFLSLGTDWKVRTQNADFGLGARRESSSLSLITIVVHFNHSLDILKDPALAFLQGCLSQREADKAPRAEKGFVDRNFLGCTTEMLGTPERVRG